MKGSQTTESKQETKLPPWVEKQAKQIQNVGNAVAQQPYMPFTGPTVASFSPMQVNSMQGTNQAAGAFGLPNVDTSKAKTQEEIMSALTGLPAPETTAGGYSGYSANPIYEQAKAGLTDYERQFIDRFFMNPDTGKSASHPFLPVTKFDLNATEQEQRREQRKRARRLVVNKGEGRRSNLISAEEPEPDPNMYYDRGYK